MDSNETAKEVVDAATGQASPEVLQKRSAKAMGLPPIVPRTLDFRQEESKPAPRRTETDKCREEISNTVAKLESLSSRLAALKEPLASLTDDQQCFYQVTLSQIADALRWPHLRLSYAEQEIRTLENVARNTSSAR